jgi:hypothetical protein
MVEPENDLDHGRLFKIHPNGEGQTPLSSTCTDTCQGDGFPSWAPSGRLIAFQRFVSADPSQEVGRGASPLDLGLVLTFPPKGS